MGGLLTSPAFQHTFPSIATGTGNAGNSTLQGFTVAIYEIGCALGALSVILYGDPLGRRRVVLLGQLILCLGAALQATATVLGGRHVHTRPVTGTLGASFWPPWSCACCSSAGSTSSRTTHQVLFQDVLGMSRNTAPLLAGCNGLEYWLATFRPHPAGGPSGPTTAPALRGGGPVLLAWLCWRRASRSPRANRPDFLVVMVSPVMINDIGYKTYLVSAATNLVFIPTIYFWIEFFWLVHTISCKV